MGGKSKIKRRKAEHVAVAASGAADFRCGTLLDEVHLVHQALPELSLDDICLTTDFCGTSLRAPLYISGMTGGYPGARDINRGLARVASALGLAFGLGSQRAMLKDPTLASTYAVRDVAPDLFVLGNLGVVQLRELGAKETVAFCQRSEVSAIAIHLNAAQEMAQDGGDRDFRGCVAAIEGLVGASPLPVIVKETGAGISPRVAAQLVGIGVAAIDVAGAGGTSWTAVESLRAANNEAGKIGASLWDWGIPTAASVAASVDTGGVVLASGGIRNGGDVAAALALGARACGIAGEALRAFRSGGEAGLSDYLTHIIETVRSICLLTQCRRVQDLRGAKRHIGATLAGWMDSLGVR